MYRNDLDGGPDAKKMGHLQAKDFVNLMEGIELPAKRRAHLDTCDDCRSRWHALESVHAGVSAMDDDIPEPDWVQFRSNVRDRVLSRTIQRETAVRRWTGWAIRPAVAWALSLLLVVGLTTVAVIWNTGKSSPPSSFVSPASEPAAEAIGAVPERGLFDDLVQLGDEEQEQLRQILESSQKGSRYQ
jgi:hypothetical protein